MTTEKAPVAGQRNAGGAGGQDQNLIRQALRAEGNLRSLNELNELLGHRLAGAGGAAAAAGVLTAVDEDGEGDEEAALPEEFEYFTDAEDDE